MSTEAQQDIIEEFALFDDWMDKYEHLIGLGKNLPLIDEHYKTDQYIIKGCQSKVWLRAEQNEGRVYFSADSDAIITKGIVSVLIRAFSGLSAQDIIDAPTDFINEIGLSDHLSPTRANGLVAMIKQMKLYATAFAAQNNA
ncbi:MAG TPA: Fe-S metabolism protein SufE [Flavobacteriaceae bacterium]|nr:Fe-S metabolism protein SufE [Flavobacteriaceae bacterium]